MLDEPLHWSIGLSYVLLYVLLLVDVLSRTLHVMSAVDITSEPLVRDGAVVGSALSYRNFTIPPLPSGMSAHVALRVISWVIGLKKIHGQSTFYENRVENCLEKLAREERENDRLRLAAGAAAAANHASEQQAKRQRTEEVEVPTVEVPAV